VTVGPKGLKEGKVEFKRRRDGESQDLPVEHAAVTVTEAVEAQRR